MSLLRTEFDKATFQIQGVARSADLLRERLDSTDGLASTLNDMISMHENVMISIEGRQRSQEEKVSLVEGLVEQLVDQRPNKDDGSGNRNDCCAVWSFTNRKTKQHVNGL